MTSAAGRRAALIAFGVLAALALCEISLRVSSLAERRGWPSDDPRRAPVILCLGESTTAPLVASDGEDISWPAQLQSILAAQGRPYRLVNKGWPGSNTTLIGAKLPGYLDVYHPIAVVAMMGVNDKHWFGIVRARRREAWPLESLLFYKAARYIYYEGPWSRPARPLPPPPDDAKACLLSDMRWLPQSAPGRARYEAVCRQAARLHPRDSRPRAALGLMYYSDHELKQAAIQCGLALGLPPRNRWAYGCLGYVFEDTGRPLEAEDMFRQAIAIDPQRDGLYAALEDLFLNEGKIRAAEEALGLSSAQDPDADYRPALVEDPDRSLDATQANYRGMRDLVLERGIPFIAMQYPTERASDLRRMLADRPATLVVENRANFAAALARGRYSDYFTDRFGGSWGHCTAKGNRLIAESAARALSRILARPAN